MGCLPYRRIHSFIVAANDKQKKRSIFSEKFRENNSINFFCIFAANFRLSQNSNMDAARLSFYAHKLIQ